MLSSDSDFPVLSFDFVGLGLFGLGCWLFGACHRLRLWRLRRFLCNFLRNKQTLWNLCFVFNVLFFVFFRGTSCNTC